MSPFVPIQILETAPYPWVRYPVLRQLKSLPETNPSALQTYDELTKHPEVRFLIKKCLEWPDPVLKSHKAASHPFHHLHVAADFGLSVRHPEIKTLVDKIMERQGDDGALRSYVELPKIWGGGNSPEWLWMFCDAPVLLHGCLALGVPENDKRIKAALDHLERLVTTKKWICCSSVEKLRGPGRKNDHCPYATLLSLRAFAASEEYRNKDFCREGTEILLSHWKNRSKVKLRMFGIGTEFSKLKYPFVFYDILHVVEVLSQFPRVWDDPRFHEMLSGIESKRDPDGLFTPESVWMAFKRFDFGSKKAPSPMITYLVERIQQRKP